MKALMIVLVAAVVAAGVYSLEIPAMDAGRAAIVAFAAILLLDIIIPE